MIVLCQKVEPCVVVSQQQVCWVGMGSLWVGLLIEGQRCLPAVPEWVDMKEQTRGSAREVRRNGASELKRLVVGIVVGPGYMCARLFSA